MGFLNAMLLFGAASLAVPLIIHLLNRSKFQVIDWGAMHLLEAAELQNSRRIQWQSILLLMIRCGIPLLLAICMARPILTAWQVAGGGGNSAVAFVIDNSYSMQASSRQAADGTSVFQTALANLDDIASGMGRGTQMSVISLGGQPKNVIEGSTFDSRIIRRRIESLADDQGPVEPTGAFDLASRILLDSSQPQRQIVILSDFQKNDWSNISNESMATFWDAFKSLPVKPRVTLLPVQSKPTDNLQATIDADFSEVVGVDDPVDVRATIHNWGSQPAKTARVVFQVDDVDIAAKNIDVAPNSDVQVIFGCKFDKEGSHRCVVHVEEASPIQADNFAELPIYVIEKLSVLLVEPAPVQDTLQAETGFLELALQMQGLSTDQSSWMKTKRVAVDALTEQAVRQADVIVIANVPRLPDQPASWIENRVKEGAGLLVFVGAKTDREWYNQRWSPQGAAAILPYRFSELLTTDATLEQNSPTEQGSRPTTEGILNQAKSDSVSVSSGPYDHPALALFNRPEQGRLDQVLVRSWIRLTPWQSDTAAKDSASSDAKTAESADIGESVCMAKLNNGDSFMAQKSFGKGSVIQFATSSNDAWTNLPLRPAFVPLVQRLVIGMFHAPDMIRSRVLKNESDLRLLDKQELASLATRMNAQVFDSTEAFLEATKLQNEGREIWRWVLLALVVFLISELLIEKRLSRGGR